MGLDDGFYFDFELLLKKLKGTVFNKQEVIRVNEVISQKNIVAINTSAIEWLKTNPYIADKGVGDVYLRYISWCARHNHLAESRMRIGTLILQELQLVSKVVRVGDKTVRNYKEL